MQMGRAIQGNGWLGRGPPHDNSDGLHLVSTSDTNWPIGQFFATHIKAASWFMCMSQVEDFWTDANWRDARIFSKGFQALMDHSTQGGVETSELCYMHAIVASDPREEARVGMSDTGYSATGTGAASGAAAAADTSELPDLDAPPHLSRELSGCSQGGNCLDGGG